MTLFLVTFNYFANVRCHLFHVGILMPCLYLAPAGTVKGVQGF